MDRSQIIDRLLAFGDRIEASGLLFHGTCVPFDLPPRPGGYDQVLWTSTSPVVAQSYIPRAGMTLFAGRPLPYQLAERVEPAPQSFWYAVVRQMGFDAIEVEVDQYQRLKSWRLPADYPTYRDAVEWLARLGYDLASNGSAEVLTARENGIEVIKPASWRMPGRLLVTIGDDLDLLDVADGREGDLTDPDYHKLGLFRHAEASREGILIHDYLQDPDYGNVGHRSYGLFGKTAARLPWLEIPATHCSWRTGKQMTPELDEFIKHLGARATPAGVAP